MPNSSYQFVTTWTIPAPLVPIWNELMAASVIGAVPVMVLYVILNRHLVQAITAGAVKG